MNKQVIVRDLGNKDYKETWDYQENLFQKIVDQKINNRANNTLLPTDNYFLFVEHPHVYTLGKSGHIENLLIDEEGLKKKGATFYKINRGGDITYHGPGQIVGYPILDLDNFFTDIHKYLRFLEEVIIRTLAEYGLKAERSEGETGVWLDVGTPFARKICAMGVRCSRWVTMHGFALNVNTDLGYFDNIIPCGIRGKAVTSLNVELAKDKVDIMPEIRNCITPRQKVNIEARDEMLLCDLRPTILEDFEYIGNLLYSEMKKKFFTTEDFAKLLKERYGIGKARIIANSLFELVDPNDTCVKHRTIEATGKTVYSLAHGNFKEYMRKSITKSRIISNITTITNSSSYSSYLSLSTDDTSMIALKLLSIFDYITYEVLGGEEPEIFIRLNDPNKIKSIVMGSTYYTNNYVTKAKQKHDRDIEVLLQFFNGLKTNEERWNYIENYFLGYDVLCNVKPMNVKSVKMSRSIDKEQSYQTHMYNGWADLRSFFDENDHVIINKLIATGVKIPEYLQTQIKKSEIGNDILMSWPSKDTLICQQDTSDIVMESFRIRGWHAYRINEIDYENIKEVLE